MSVLADIVVESPDRRRVLIAECRRAKETTDVVAVEWRRNYHAHGLDIVTTFFLLVFPTQLFLWRANAPLDARPDFVAPAKPVLKRYLGRWADQPGGPLAESLEIAVSTWLSDLASGILEPDLTLEADRMVVQSGLLERIKGGAFKTHVSA